MKTDNINYIDDYKTQSEIDNKLKATLCSNDFLPPQIMKKIKAVANNTTQLQGKRSKNSFLRVLVAAALCTILLMSATALAMNIFRMRDLELPVNEEDKIVRGIMPDGEVVERPVQLITYSYPGTPEYAAAVEWQEYLNTFDKNAVYADPANDHFFLSIPEKYWHYGVWSQQMVDKLDEIVNRHGLSLFGRMIGITSKLDHTNQEELQSLIAYGPLFTDASITFAGYMFEDGTFKFDGGYGDVRFFFRHSRKGVLDPTSINVGNIDDYTEWNYTNTHGIPLHLMQSSERSFIYFETETAYIFVGISAGTESNNWFKSAPPFTDSDLEAFADLIDFDQLRSEVPLSIVAKIEARRIEERDAADVINDEIFPTPEPSPAPIP